MASHLRRANHFIFSNQTQMGIKMAALAQHDLLKLVFQPLLFNYQYKSVCTYTEKSVEHKSSWQFSCFVHRNCTEKTMP